MLFPHDCADAGLGAIGIWREQLAEVGLDEACRLVTESGLRVSSLCRGGLHTTADPAEARAAEGRNREALEEAAALKAATLVLLPGGSPGTVGSVPSSGWFHTPVSSV